jgi:hypothetical protein
MATNSGVIVPLRLLASAMRGDFGGNRKSLQPDKLLIHGAPDCARHNPLKFWPDSRRQRGCKVLDYCFGAFFRRHGKTLSERGTIRAREIAGDGRSRSGLQH